MGTLQDVAPVTVQALTELGAEDMGLLWLVPNPRPGITGSSWESRAKSRLRRAARTDGITCHVSSTSTGSFYFRIVSPAVPL
jgi:hypothetical protein